MSFIKLFCVQSLKWFLFSLISYFIYVYLLKPLIHSIFLAINYRSFPTSSNHWLLGHLTQIWTNFPFPCNLEKVQRKMYEVVNKIVAENPGQSLVILWAGLYPVIIVSDYEAAEIVLNKKNINKIFQYKYMALGDGLVTAEPELWRIRRKLIEPFFTTKRIKSYAKYMNEEVESFTESLDGEVGKRIDLEHQINLSTLNLILKSTANIPLNDSIDDKKMILECVEKMATNVFRRSINFLYHYDWIFKFFQVGKSFFETENLIKKKIDQIQSRREKLFQPHEMFDQDLIHLLDGKIDGQGLNDELRTLVVAGHETTALSLRWLLMNLGNHLDEQEKLFQEIVQFFPDDTPVNDIDKINECTYLDQCIKESLRLNPPIHVVFRMLEEDLMVKDRKLFKGSFIVVSFPSIHRDERIYPEPDKFDPDRWSPQNVHKIPKSAFIPFSYGPRNCIGYRYALIELKIYAIQLIRKFSLRSIRKSESIPSKFDVTLKPCLPLEIILTPRNNDNFEK